MQPDKETIISRILKLRATANDHCGNANERENASRLAMRLQEVYTISEDDLRFEEAYQTALEVRNEQVMNGMLIASAGFLVISMYSFFRAVR